MPPSDLEYARRIALDALTTQARSKADLQALLKRKGVSDDVATDLLTRFEEVGLIDDQKFASDWVASRQHRKRLSKRALRSELTRKGVDRDHIFQALENVTREDELQAAIELAQSKVQRTEGLDMQVRVRRLAGILSRRGFDAQIVRQVISQVLDVEDD